MHMDMNRWSMVVLGAALWASCSSPAPPPPDEAARTESTNDLMLADEEAVKAAVDRFLVAIGSYDLEALPAMFTSNANIGAVSFGDGTWRTKTYTFDDFLALLRSRTNPSPYQEPVSQYTVHVERGGLAFVRADATLYRDNEARSHNIDYFTLIKEDGTWKFLSASYVATPISNE